MQRFELVWPQEMVAAIDDWRKRQEGAPPSRAECVRRFVAEGLKAEQERGGVQTA